MQQGTSSISHKTMLLKELLSCSVTCTGSGGLVLPNQHVLDEIKLISLGERVREREREGERVESYRGIYIGSTLIIWLS